MSSEVCPFCGKTFKRLRTHLPHCKAAAGPPEAARTRGGSSPAVGAKGEKVAAAVAAAASSSSPVSAKKKKKPPPAGASPSTQGPSGTGGKASGAPKVPKGPPKGAGTASGAKVGPGQDASRPRGDRRPPEADAPAKEGARPLPAAPGGGPRPGITLQDARALLGRDRRALGPLVHIQPGADPPRSAPPRLPPAARTPPTPPPLARVPGETGPSGSSAAGVPAGQHLAQVRLKDVPGWLVANGPSRPSDLVEVVRKGWRWYYGKYIDVKKGGVAGVGMLLAGYCVLSYAWAYPHIKRDRWRKFH